MKSPIFQVKFDDSVKDYNKVDGILAIAYFLYILLFTVLFGFLVFRTNYVGKLTNLSGISSKAAFEVVFYIPVALIEAGPVFIILKCRKQSLNSIGVKKDKIIKSILLGVLFSIPPILSTLHQMSFERFSSSVNFSNALWTFFYNFFEIAFVEEIIFRGFIQTRIQGLIRSKWTSIFLVGIMFSLLHIPFHMIEYNLSFSNYFTSSNVSFLLLGFLMHIYFVYAYTRDNNILAPVVAHAIVDFIPDLFSGM